MSEFLLLKSLLELDSYTRAYFEHYDFDYKDYSLNNLKQLERLIESVFPLEEDADFKQVIPYGFFLGQLLTNTIPGACWDDMEHPDQTGIDMSVSVKINIQNTKMMLFPMRRATRFIGDRSESIVSFYELTKEFSDKTLNLNLKKMEPNIKSQTENGINFEIRSSENVD